MLCQRKFLVSLLEDTKMWAMLIQFASGSGRPSLWQYECMKGGKVAFRSIICGNARKACKTKFALCWAKGLDIGKQVRNPTPAGTESMFPDAEEKSGVS
jgi:hypothetical protein